jgi:hypothetical protein
VIENTDQQKRKLEKKRERKDEKKRKKQKWLKETELRW